MDAYKLQEFMIALCRPDQGRCQEIDRLMLNCGFHSRRTAAIECLRSDEGTILAKALGLDFGTTNSALALAQPDGSVQLAQVRGNTTLRSILYFEEHVSSTQR